MLMVLKETSPPPWAFLLLFSGFLGLAWAYKRYDAQDVRRWLASDLGARGIGLLILFMGVMAGSILAYGPIVDALAHRRTILLHRGAVSIPVVIVLAGLVMLVGGRRSTRLLFVPPGQRITPLQWGFIAVLTGIVLAVELGFERFLHILGYR